MASIVCAGCGNPIVERTLLSALDRFWHISCLNCSFCGLRLDELGPSVFVRSNLLLCRQDYLKIFGLSGTCARCRSQIPADELVMRCQDKVYHVNCFACNRCHTHLQPGDKVCSVNGTLFCEHEFPQLFSGGAQSAAMTTGAGYASKGTTAGPLVKWPNTPSRQQVQQQPQQQQPPMDMNVDTVSPTALDMMMLMTTPTPMTNSSAVTTTSVVMNGGGFSNGSLARRPVSSTSHQQVMLMSGGNTNIHSGSSVLTSVIPDRPAVSDIPASSPIYYGSTGMLPPGMMPGPGPSTLGRSNTPTMTTMIPFDPAVSQTQPSPSLCASPSNVLFTPMVITGSGVGDPNGGGSAAICHQTALDPGTNNMEVYAPPSDYILGSTLGVQPTLVSTKELLINKVTTAGGTSETTPNGGGRKKQKKVDSRRCPPLRVC